MNIKIYFQANASLLRGPTIKYIGREGLETTTLGLHFIVEAHHFKRGDMKIKCLATIATVYWNSNEESVESEKAQRNPAFDVREEIVPREKSRADRVQGLHIRFNSWYLE